LKNIIEKLPFQFYFDENSAVVAVSGTVPSYGLYLMLAPFFVATYAPNFASSAEINFTHEFDFADLASKIKDKKCNIVEYLSKQFELDVKFNLNFASLVPEWSKEKHLLDEELPKKRGLSIPFFQTILSLLQIEGNSVYKYKELKTLNILDLLLPTFPKRILTKDGLRQKVAQQITKHTSGEKPKFAFLKPAVELLTLEEVTDISLSFIAPPDLILFTVDLKTGGIATFLETMKHFAEHAEDEGDEDAAKEEEEEDGSESD